VPPLLGVAPEQHRTASILVALTGLHMAIALMVVPPSAVLRGLQRYDLHNTIIVVNSIVEGAAVAGVLLAGFRVVGMLVAMIVVNGLTGLATIVLVKRIAGDIPLGVRGAHRTAFRRIVSFSSSMFAIQLGSRMYNKSDEFVIAAAYALSGVTPYALARKIAELCEMVAAQFAGVLLPFASELDASDDRIALRKLYVTASRVALATVVPIAAIAGVTGSDILRLWVGPEYARYSILIVMLAAAAVLMTSQRPAVEVLMGMAQHRIVAITSVIAGVCNIVVSIVLLRRFGLVGVALGTLVPTAVMSLGVVGPFANRRLGVSWRTSVYDIWLPAIVPAIPAATLLWSLQRAFPGPTAVVLAGWIAAALTVYGVGFICMPASKAERRLVGESLAGGCRLFRRTAADTPQ
jgi:O-antigen/teichoic acid export membrane protein